MLHLVLVVLSLSRSHPTLCLTVFAHRLSQWQWQRLAVWRQQCQYHAIPSRIPPLFIQCIHPHIRAHPLPPLQTQPETAQHYLFASVAAYLLRHST